MTVVSDNPAMMCLHSASKICLSYQDKGRFMSLLTHWMNAPIFQGCLHPANRSSESWNNSLIYTSNIYTYVSQLTSRPEVDIQAVFEPLTRTPCPFVTKEDKTRILRTISSLLFSRIRRCGGGGKRRRNWSSILLRRKRVGCMPSQVKSVSALAHAIQVPMGCMPAGNVASLLSSNSPTYIG